MSELTKEVLERETERFSEDNRTAQLDSSLRELDRMGLVKKNDFKPSMADTVGRRLYELESPNKRWRF